MAIQPLIINSPAMSWLYWIFSARQTSALIGLTETAIAILILLRPALPMLCSIGSAGAGFVFLGTLSFLVSTPGVWALAEGFPVPAGAGGFIVKDVFLLAAALWSFQEAFRAAAERSSIPARQESKQG